MKSSLGEVIKRMAVGANEAGAPTSILFGIVTSVNPLEITVEQKLKLTKEFLVLTKNVKDYTVDVSMNWNTESASIDANHQHSCEITSNNEDISVSINNQNIDLTHSHNLKGKKSITIHNGLKINDTVILIQQQGGSNFVVLDKF